MELARKKGKDDLDWRGERDWDSGYSPLSTELAALFPSEPQDLVHSEKSVDE